MHSSARQQIFQSMADRAPPVKVWAQQHHDLKTLWHAGAPTEEIAENLGRSVSAVLTQAARLGLARRAAPGRKTKTAKVKTSMTNVIAFCARENLAAQEILAARHAKRDRNCLMCSTSFNSHGSHNRICPRCKAGAAYQIAHTDDYQVLSA